MQVTAAVARSAGGDFVLEEVELDEPRADEILVRIGAVGVCHTDLVARDGGMPVCVLQGSPVYGGFKPLHRFF